VGGSTLLVSLLMQPERNSVLAHFEYRFVEARRLPQPPADFGDHVAAGHRIHDEAAVVARRFAASTLNRKHL
jgi:hypothetical protein